MEKAAVFGLYVVASMIACLIISKTKIGKKMMEYMLDKLTMK